MKIAVFIPSFRGGGAERAMLIFAAELVKKGMEVDLIVTTTQGPLLEDVPQGVRLINLNQPRMLRSIRSLAAYLRRERPAALYSTIVHANVGSILASILSRTKTPVIVRESNVPVTEPKKNLARWMTFKLTPYTYGLARGIIAVSEGVASELRELSPALSDRIHVIPTPVVYTELFEKASAPLEDPWFSEQSQIPVIVGAARLQPHKSFDKLIRAFAVIRKERPVKLVILGEGPEKDRLLEDARKLGVSEDVRLTGFVPNPFPYMKRASTFALVSQYEGMPNVLIQAMALGTPVVATDCPSGPSEVLEKGKYGALIPVDDHEALVKALRLSIESERRPDAADHVRRIFGSEEAAVKYLAVGGLNAN